MEKMGLHENRSLRALLGEEQRRRTLTAGEKGCGEKG